MPNPPATPSSPTALREAGKFITVSLDLPEKKSPTGSGAGSLRPPSLLEIAQSNQSNSARVELTGGADMSRAEQALQSALLRAWEPPSPSLVPVGKRSVIVRLALLKDGSIQDATLHTPSGSAELDASVSALLSKVTRIPESLPANFPGPRYPLRIHLQID
jgi:hypothetical protein